MFKIYILLLANLRFKRCQVVRGQSIFIVIYLAHPFPQIPTWFLNTPLGLVKLLYELTQYWFSKWARLEFKFGVCFCSNKISNPLLPQIWDVEPTLNLMSEDSSDFLTRVFECWSLSNSISARSWVSATRACSSGWSASAATRVRSQTRSLPTSSATNPVQVGWMISLCCWNQSFGSELRLTGYRYGYLDERKRKKRIQS